MAPNRAAQIAALIVVVLAAAAPALAQDQPAVKIATVDITAIQAEYGELQTQQQVLEQWLAEERKFYNLLTDYIFLSSENFQEVMDLLRKVPPRSQEDHDRLTELQGVSDEKDKRFRDLEAKVDRTAQEQDEFNSLQDISSARVKAIEQMWQQTLAELGEKRETAVGSLMGRVSDAIKAEAEAQGFDIVVDADAVFFGGTDITEQVLARLNAGQPVAEAGDEGGGEAGGGEGDGQ